MVSYKATPADVASYWEKGYWISPKLIDDAQIARLRAAMDRLFKGETDGNGSFFDGALKVPEDPLAMRRAINAWWVNDEIRDMVLDPGLGALVAAFMKTPRARLWADQVIIKPGTQGKGSSKGGNIGWHQDAAYWHINNASENMVTAWIALQDTDLAIGGMRTLEHSHRWGLIKDSDKFYDPNLTTQREYFEKNGLTPWVDEPCILPAGHASFHHSLCFHGSEENKTAQPRMSVIGHYMPDGAAFVPSGKYQVFLRLLGPRPEPGTKFEGVRLALGVPGVMMFRLDNKVAIVTGAARGLGAAAVATLTAQSARVAAVDLRAEEIRGAEKAYQADVSKVEEIKRLVDDVVRDFGRIDILVNNAGICPRLAFVDSTEADWDRLVSVNAKSQYFFMQAVHPVMKRQGGGRIINVASTGGRIGSFANASIYSGTKGAIVMFSKSVARELAADGILINCIAPGVMDTDLMRNLPAERVKAICDQIPLKRLGKPEEVAALIAFMASDECSYCTGATFDINGGWVML